MKTTGTRNRISTATFAGDRRSPVGLLGSFLLHGAVVIGTLFTVSHTLDIADQSAPVIPVDVVTIAQKTNIRASAHRAPHIAPTPTPPVPKEMPAPPQVQPQPPPPAPSPPQPQPAPPKEAEAEPLAEAPQPVIPKHRPQPPPKQQEVKQPEDQPQDTQKKSFDVDKVLALLNKVAPSKAAAPDAPESERTVRGVGAQNAMTADLQDALRSQVQRCWSPPVGAPHPERLIVTFDLVLNPDGSVAQPPQSLGNSDDPYFHAAREAALRAIYTCAPYKLPADRYTQWREIKPFIFDPRQMLGQ